MEGAVGLWCWVQVTSSTRQFVKDRMAQVALAHVDEMEEGGDRPARQGWQKEILLGPVMVQDLPSIPGEDAAIVAPWQLLQQRAWENIYSGMY